MGRRLLELIIPATYQAQPTLFPLVVFLVDVKQNKWEHR